MEAYTCGTCGKKCKSKREFQFHTRTRSCKNLKCSDCGTLFNKQRDLNRHLKNRKKTWCDDCQITTCNHMQWNQHMNSHKEVPESFPIHRLSQLIQPRTGYEDYEGYQELLIKKDGEIRNKETEGIYKKIINKKIDYTYTYNDLLKNLLIYMTTK